MDTHGITWLGQTNFRNEERKFGIKEDDRRRHIYIIGKTGVGKSTLLENMIIEDINQGRGVAFIDPHGESAEKILDYVPLHRVDDVVYLDPSDSQYPIAFNPLEQVDPEFRHLVASGMMGVLKKIWADAWSARMEYIMNNTLLALLEYPGTTLLGIMRMLNDPIYRKEVVDNLKDPVVKGFWTNEFARYSQKFETEATAAIQNKVGQFVSNPLVRNILGQSHSSIDLRKVMDESKILIVNLSKGRIGEGNSALLGAMIITKIQLAAMSRVDIPEAKRRDFYLTVDEFQNFATESFATILSEARKYRLSLTVANQYLSQLDNDGKSTVKDAIFGNVGTIIVFRVGAEDGEFLEKEFLPEFEGADMVNLAKYSIYMKLMIDGISSRPFSAHTLVPPVKPTRSYREEIIQNARTRYATPKAQVEAKIAAEFLEQGGGIAHGPTKTIRKEEKPIISASARKETEPLIKRVPISSASAPRQALTPVTPTAHPPPTTVAPQEPEPTPQPIPSVPKPVAPTPKQPEPTPRPTPTPAPQEHAPAPHPEAVHQLVKIHQTKTPREKKPFDMAGLKAMIEKAREEKSKEDTPEIKTP